MAGFEAFLGISLHVLSKLKSYSFFFLVGEAAASGVRGCSRRKSGACEGVKSCPAVLGVSVTVALIRVFFRCGGRTDALQLQDLIVRCTDRDFSPRTDLQSHQECRNVASVKAISPLPGRREVRAERSLPRGYRVACCTFVPHGPRHGLLSLSALAGWFSAVVLTRSWLCRCCAAPNA